MTSVHLFIIAVLLPVLLKPASLRGASLGLGKICELSPCEMALFPYARNSANLIKIGGEASTVISGLWTRTLGSGDVYLKLHYDMLF